MVKCNICKKLFHSKNVYAKYTTCQSCLGNTAKSVRKESDDEEIDDIPKVDLTGDFGFVAESIVEAIVDSVSSSDDFTGGGGGFDGGGSSGEW